MKAVILAGGYATRLQPLSSRLPKLLLPVAGKPVAAYLFEMLKDAGVKEAVISLNRRQGIVQSVLGGEYGGLKVSYVFEESKGDEDKLGAVGAMRFVAQQAKITEDCLIVGSDNFVYGLDLRKMVGEHKKRKPHATIALFDLVDKADVEHFGVALLEGRRIARFQEKPRVEEAISKLASTAVYHVSSSFLKNLDKFVAERKAQGKKADRLGDLWEYLVKDEVLEGFVFQGVWGDIGSPETYIETNKLAMNFLTSGVIDKQGGAFFAGNQLHVAATAQIGAGAVIRGPAILEDGVRVGKDAVIGPYTHLMKASAVGDNAAVSGSIVFEGAVIGGKCQVRDSIIDRNAILAENCRVDDYSLIGEECALGEGCRVFSRTRLWPRLQIDREAVVEGTVRTR